MVALKHNPAVKATPKRMMYKNRLKFSEILGFRSDCMN